jgi:hypothetical protein
VFLRVFSRYFIDNFGGCVEALYFRPISRVAFFREKLSIFLGPPRDSSQSRIPTLPAISSLSGQVDLSSSISVLISLQLWNPIFTSGVWYCSSPTLRMLMPKAAVYEYHLVSARKNNVRCAREIVPVNSEAIAGSVQQSTQRLFRFCVLVADTPHIIASADWIQNMHTFLNWRPQIFALAHLCGGAGCGPRYRSPLK